RWITPPMLWPRNPAGRCCALPLPRPAPARGPIHDRASSGTPALSSASEAVPERYSGRINDPRRALAKPRDCGGGAPDQGRNDNALAGPGDTIVVARSSGTSPQRLFLSSVFEGLAGPETRVGVASRSWRRGAA